MKQIRAGRITTLTLTNTGPGKNRLKGKGTVWPRKFSAEDVQVIVRASEENNRLPLAEII